MDSHVALGRLRVARARVVEAQRELALADQLAAKERALDHRLRRLRASAATEQADVDRLNSAGLLGALRRLSRNHEADVRRETDEAAVARLALTACERDLADVRLRRGEHVACAELLGDAEAKFAVALDRADRAVCDGDGQLARTLRAHSTAMAECDRLAGRQREIVDAGERALAAVDGVLSALDDAAAPGLLDISRSELLADARRVAGVESAMGRVASVQEEFSRLAAVLGGDAAAELTIAPEGPLDRGGVTDALRGTRGWHSVQDARDRLRAARRQVLRPLVAARKEAKRLDHERVRLGEERVNHQLGA